MNKTLPYLIICLSLAFVSCKSKTENKPLKVSINNENKILKEDTLKIENPFIQNYKLFILQLDTTNINSVTQAAKKYKETFVGQSYSVCDSAFDIFNKYYKRMEATLNQTHINDTTNFDAFVVEQQNPLPQKLKNYRRNLLNNGFDIDSEEGMTYIKQDRNIIAKYFYDIISPSMKAYQIQQNIENAEGFVSDASIEISPERLIDRLIWHEKFEYENPEFQYITDCKIRKKMYLSMLFYGIDNTPLFSFDNPDKLSRYFEKAYTYLISKYPGAKSTATVKPYYEAILAKDKSKSEEILQSYLKRGLIN